MTTTDALRKLVAELREHKDTGWRSEADGFASGMNEAADRLDAILREDVGGWRSMDSTPRDGTFVLLWVPADERAEGYCEVGSWVRSAGYWDIGTARQPDSMFTHWHAEPPPPPEFAS